MSWTGIATIAYASIITAVAYRSQVGKWPQVQKLPGIILVAIRSTNWRALIWDLSIRVALSLVVGLPVEFLLRWMNWSGPLTDVAPLMVGMSVANVMLAPLGADDYTTDRK